MEDLFRSYWWLLFPLAWLVIGGWNAWLKERSRRDTVSIIKGYASSGREVPAELMDKLTQRNRTGG